MFCSRAHILLIPAMIVLLGVSAASAAAPKKSPSENRPVSFANSNVLSADELSAYPSEAPQPPAPVKKPVLDSVVDFLAESGEAIADGTQDIVEESGETISKGAQDIVDFTRDAFSPSRQETASK